MAHIILVHGAWHGPWCWQRLIQPLQDRGIESTAVALTTSGNHGPDLGDYDADIKVVTQAIEAVDEPVVLLGHSYGGLVVSQAAVGRDDIARLVYLGAFIPEPGESMRSLTGGGNAPWLSVDESGVMTVAPGWGSKLFYSDATPEDAAWAESQLTGQAAWSFGAEVAAVAYRDLPSTYIVTNKDQAVSPDAQRMWASRMTNMVEIDSGHSPFLSQPDVLADVLADCVAAEG